LSTEEGQVRKGNRILWAAALVLLAALATAVLAACGGGGGGGGEAVGTGQGPVPEPTSPVTVNFASWVGEDLKPYAKKFHELHPNITIKFQNVPAEELTQKVLTQIAGGNPPDAAYMDSSAVPDFASRGALVGLKNYIARSDIVDPNDYVAAFKQNGIYQGQLYGLPFDGETTGLFYRTDLFQEAGISAPPKTWDEFLADVQKLTIPAKKQYGYIVFAPESAYYWYPWLYQAGGDTLTPDGKHVAFNSPEGKQAAEFYVNLAKYSPPDFLNSNSYDGRVAFQTGKVAMYMAGAWFAGTLRDEFPEINGKWAAAPLPIGPSGKCATTIAGDTLVVFSGGENHDAAWKWIEYLSDRKVMKQWNLGSPASTLLPTRTSLLNDPTIFQQKPLLKAFADLMPCGVVSKVIQPAYPEVEQVLNEQLGKAFYGDITADEALDKAAQEGEDILAKRG
jgi:multiple sugar transport system substrate-binding protein